MKINIDPFIKALLIVIFISIIPAIANPQYRKPAKVAKIKSKLKQIGTTVAMYFSDGLDNKYPKNPSLFQIDHSLIYTNKTENWIELSLNSPYLFFPNEGDEYTGSAEKPLAINWEHINVKPYYQVVWEDGHVSSVSAAEAEKMINSSLKNQMTRILYNLNFKNNPPLQ